MVWPGGGRGECRRGGISRGPDGNDLRVQPVGCRLAEPPRVRPTVRRRGQHRCAQQVPHLAPPPRKRPVLPPTHRNDLAPTATGKGAPFPSGLGSIAYAPPTPWPVP